MTLEQETKRQSDLLSKMHGALGGLTKAEYLLIGSLGTVASVLGKAATDIFALNKVGGNLGLSLDKQLSQYDNVIGALSDTADVVTSLGLAMSAQRAGLDGTNIGLMKLANQQRLLTGSSDKVISTMANLAGSTGMSTERIRILSLHLMMTSETYNVATDTLLDGINKLANQLVKFEAMGLGPQVTDAVASLTAKFPAMSETIGMAVKSIAEGSVEGLGLAAKIGAMNEKAAFAGAQTAEETERALVGFIQKYAAVSSERLQQWSGGVGGVLTGTRIMEGVFGENATHMIALISALERGSVTQIAMGDKAKQARETLSAAFGRLWGSIMIALIPAFRTLTYFVGLLADAINFVLGPFRFLGSLVAVGHETNEKLGRLVGIAESEGRDISPADIAERRKAATVTEEQNRAIASAFNLHRSVPDDSQERMIELYLSQLALQRETNRLIKFLSR